MTRLQLQGLCLWAGMLVLLLLAVFPLTSGWRAAAAGLVVAMVALAWRRLSCRAENGANALQLPPTSYRHPVLLVCGDGLNALFGLPPEEQMTLRITEQACYIRVPDTVQLSTLAAQILDARPTWRGQLCVLSVIDPCQHADSAVLTGQLRRLDHQLALVRRRCPRLPLMVLSYLHSQQVHASWFGWSAGQADPQVWAAGVCSSLAHWQRQAAGTNEQALRLQTCVRLQGLAQWFDAILPDRAQGGAGTCFAILSGPAPGPWLANNLWQRWLQSQLALEVVETPAPADAAQPLFPDALLHLLPVSASRPTRLLAHGLGLWLWVGATLAALLSSAWQNTLLMRQVSDDLRRYSAIAPGPHTDAQRQAAVAVLRQRAQRLDHYYRQGEPWSLGLGLYQGERLRPPLLAAIADYRQPLPPSAPAASTLRLDSLSLFSSGSAQLKPESTKVLVNALVGIKAQPGWLIVIAGHTDATGNPAHNIRLSRARAAAVHDWLMRMGDIPDSCFAVQGFGASQPLASNDSEHGRAANRRVEIRLVPEPGACAPPTAASGQTLSHAAASNI